MLLHHWHVTRCCLVVWSHIVPAQQCCKGSRKGLSGQPCPTCHQATNPEELFGANPPNCTCHFEHLQVCGQFKFKLVHTESRQSTCTTWTAGQLHAMQLSPLLWPHIFESSAAACNNRSNVIFQRYSRSGTMGKGSDVVARPSPVVG